MTYGPRRVTADDEGFVYFAKTSGGGLYGPYSTRGTAAGVLTQVDRYSRTVYDYTLGRYVTNPKAGKVLKARFTDFEDAPRLTPQEKIKNAATRIKELEAERDRLLKLLDLS